ncbi:hypothetical protein [Hyphomicrobium sp.]|uniref:hypothetical protein n=1 Tax=Hyphomicrobium sp. TaxID=82 RepID=UPI003F708285
MLSFALPAHAEPPAPDSDEAAIRDVIAQWYASLQERGMQPPSLAKRKHWQLYAPGAIDGGPRETEIYPDSRARSPTISNELAARALTFAYDVDALKIDERFAKASVWERGYFYAFAAQQTYENAAAALFILEKQSDGRWLILAHQANSIGIPPTKKTEPLPDLRDHFYRTQGKDRDPAADALEKGKF